MDDAVPFRQIIDMLPQCIFWKDAHGAFVGCNLAGARALGLAQPGDIKGMVDADFHEDPMVASYLRGEDEKVMRGGIPIYCHVSQGSGPPESARWYETSKVPLRDAAGDIAGLLICYEDVTAQKEAGHRLTALNASLASRIEEAAANAAAQERLLLQQSRYAGMGEMIDYIAHQWRQPLTALTLLLQNIQYDAQDGLIDAAGLSHRIGRAFHVVDGMSSTIDDFRNFFRPVDADVEFDAVACIDKVLRLMEPSLKHGQVQVTVNAAGPAPVTGRPNELAQVVLNLLTNAQDAVVAHRIDGRRIEIDVGSDGERLTIRERNNGGCIPDDQLGRIFGPYYTTKKDGTGLGLHMSRQIIDRHFGGSIACANVGDGVEFVMTLPLAGAA